MTRATTRRRARTTAAVDDTLTLLIDAIHGEVDSVFTTMEWADDEIERASRRHPAHADLLYHAFTLLRPRELGSGFATEFVYRSHAAELLRRIATGADTRPATAAELCVVCADVSTEVPLHTASAGLYFRMWTQAFPDHPHTPTQIAEQRHYESLYGSQIDDMERDMRRKVADPNRRFTNVDCAGRHHGHDVTCRFATSPGAATPARATRRRPTARPTPAVDDRPAPTAAGR